MGKFLILWQQNLQAWPTDPKESLELSEKVWAGMDNLRKMGQVKDSGTFLDGLSGYVIGEGESADLFKSVNMFSPLFTCEVQEIIPFEKSIETWREVMKSRIEGK